MDRHPIFAFVTRDPYPFNFADELGVSNFAELAPHNALSISLVYLPFQILRVRQVGGDYRNGWLVA